MAYAANAFHCLILFVSSSVTYVICSLSFLSIHCPLIRVATLIPVLFLTYPHLICIYIIYSPLIIHISIIYFFTHLLTSTQTFSSYLVCGWLYFWQIIQLWFYSSRYPLGDILSNLCSAVDDVIVLLFRYFFSLLLVIWLLSPCSNVYLCSSLLMLQVLS